MKIYFVGMPRYAHLIMYMSIAGGYMHTHTHKAVRIDGWIHLYTCLIVFVGTVMCECMSDCSMQE